ncbi:hypothetical protein B566_EDAN017746 [Ephemera danica]|nr:hypothetical protein B566_EDAN017746 [Ephemera danica]
MNYIFLCTFKFTIMKFSVESQFISTDVTALKIIQESVFAGIGNYLHVFNLHNGSLEGKRLIFAQQKIHGFALQDEKLLVYGGRQFMVLSRSRLTDITECKNTQDWILTAEWLENSSLALALAHNVVVLWCDREKRFLETVGVIFGLAWDVTLRRVLSCSDDRSVRVWRVSEGDWKDVNVTQEYVSYGHVARVWRVVPAAGLLVSAGEDSKLVQYELLGGRQVASHADVHQGGSIWSIDVDPEKRLIVTGGGDGGICLWPLGASPALDVFPLPAFIGKRATVRRVALCASGRVLALLQCGDLAVWREQFGWTNILCDLKWNPHAILAVSPCRRRFALSAPLTIVVDAEPVDLLSLHWPASHLLLTVEVVKGRRKLWRWENDARILWQDWLPDADSGFTVTAALALDDRWLALGGAHGAVTLVDMTGQQASLRVPRVVPGNLVSSLHFQASVLTVTGKGGHVREMELQADVGSLCLRGSEAAQTGLGWLVGARDTHLGRLNLAFHREHLSLHLLQRTVLSVKCGGGHRSWDVTVTGDIVTVVFVRDHQMHRLQTSLNRIAPPVLRMGLHCRTVNHAVSLTKNHLVSAGDDGGVRVWRPGREEPSAPFVPTQHVAQLAAHVSSVRALCVARRDGKITLFSAGGRAQLVAWRIHHENHTVGVALLHSHMLCEPSERCRTPWADTHFRPRPDPETRYMSLSELPTRDENDSEIRILAACSDAQV